MEILVKAIITYSIVCWGLFLLVSKKDFTLLNLFAVLLPIKALYFEVGLQLLGFFIPLILALVYELIVKKGRHMKIHYGWLLFILYTVVSTIIITKFFIPEFQSNYYGGYFREEGRYITYLIKTVFFQTGIFWMIYSVVQSKERILSLLKSYIDSVKVLALIGLFQVLVYIPTKFNIAPIGVHRDGRVRHALADLFVSGLGIPRVCSLGGEPKGLAATLCVAFLILFVAKKYKFNLSRNIDFWMLYFVLILILTLSTGGFGLLVLALVIPYLIYFSIGQLKFKINTKIIALVFGITSIVAWKWESVYRVLDARIISRADDLADEDVDAAIQAFMFDQPEWTIFGSGSGNIHNLAYDYIKERWIRRMLKGQIFVSRYGYTRIISENGFVGMFFFLVFVFSVPFVLLFMRRPSDMGYFLIVLSIMMIIFYFARSRYVEAEMFFILGLGAAWSRIVKKKPQLIT